MTRSRRILSGATVIVLLGVGTEAVVAQDRHVVTASSADVDAEGADAYRWIDRAQALWNAIGGAPPDYGFRFDGGDPVAWQTGDGYWVVAEERPQGPRTYFFAPGERGPFLVREAERSFGYQDGDVAAVYDGGGTLLSRYDAAGWLRAGEDLYQRGRRLRNALLDRQWSPVDTTSWTDLNLFFVGIDQSWDSGWRYRDSGFAITQQRRWAEERARRAAMAAAYARWRNGGFQGAPPPGLGHQWQHRPPRPGNPPYAAQPPRPARPPVAVQPLPAPGPGRPGRPWMWGGLPGSGGEGHGRPQNGPRPAPPPGAVPGTPLPATGGPGQPPIADTPHRHEWGAGRPRPDGSVARPPRGDGDGPGRAGWQGPRPGWQGGRPAPTISTPAAPTPAAPAPTGAAPVPPTPAPSAAPRRGGGWMSPGWMRQGRQETGGGEPPRPAFRPPAARPEAAPVPMRPSPPPAAAPAPAQPAARPMPQSRPEARPMGPMQRPRQPERAD